jgi:hypothetical protein
LPEKAFRWNRTAKQMKQSGSFHFLPTLFSQSTRATYTNPIFTADRDWLHLEARYNYEDLETGSVWLGCNLSAGNSLKVRGNSNARRCFGNITGVAPGYEITVDYKTLEFSMQGEYFFDVGTSSGYFFYTWSELSDSPLNGSGLALRLSEPKLQEVAATSSWDR